MAEEEKRLEDDLARLRVSPPPPELLLPQAVARFLDAATRSNATGIRALHNALYAAAPETAIEAAAPPTDALRRLAAMLPPQGDAPSSIVPLVLRTMFVLCAKCRQGGKRGDHGVSATLEPSSWPLCEHGALFLLTLDGEHVDDARRGEKSDAYALRCLQSDDAVISRAGLELFAGQGEAPPAVAVECESARRLGSILAADVTSMPAVLAAYRAAGAADAADAATTARHGPSRAATAVLDGLGDDGIKALCSRVLSLDWQTKVAVEDLLWRLSGDDETAFTTLVGGVGPAAGKVQREAARKQQQQQADGQA